MSSYMNSHKQKFTTYAISSITNKPFHDIMQMLIYSCIGSQCITVKYEIDHNMNPGIDPRIISFTLFSQYDYSITNHAVYLGSNGHHQTYKLHAIDWYNNTSQEFNVTNVLPYMYEHAVINHQYKKYNIEVININDYGISKYLNEFGYCFLFHPTIYCGPINGIITLVENIRESMFISMPELHMVYDEVTYVPVDQNITTKNNTKNNTESIEHKSSKLLCISRPVIHESINSDVKHECEVFSHSSTNVDGKLCLSQVSPQQLCCVYENNCSNFIIRNMFQ